MKINKISNNIINFSIIQEIRNNKFIYIGTIFCALLFYNLIKDIILTTHDDITIYLHTRGQSFHDIFLGSFLNSVHSGRIFRFTSVIFVYILYALDNIIVYRILHFLFLLFSVLSLWHLLYLYIDKYIALLSVLVFFSFAQITSIHNTFVSFPEMQLYIGFIFLSIEKLLKYYKLTKTKYLIYSAVFLLIPTMFYETFIMFSIMIFFISIFYTKNIKTLFINLRFHIIFISIYLIIYFYGRLTAQNTTLGSIFEIQNIKDSFISLFIYSTGLFPLSSFLRIFKNIDNSSYIDFISILKALISSIIIIILIKKVNINKKIYPYILGTSMLGIFLPVILLCVTPVYPVWAINYGIFVHVPSYYSYFFISVFLTILCVFIYSYIPFKKIYLVIVFFIVFLGNICTDINNKIISIPFHEQLNKYKTLEKMLLSEYFLNIENGSDVFVPDFIGIHNYPNSFNKIYFKNNNNHYYNFTNDINDLNFNKPTYILKYNKNSNSMFAGPINKDMYSNELIIVSLNPLRSSSLILSQEKSGIITVNENYRNIYNMTAIIPLNTNDDNVFITCNNVDIQTSDLVLSALNENSLLSLIFGEGFYSIESINGNGFRWCNNIGYLNINNKTGDEINIKFSGNIYTNYEEYSTISIKKDNIIYSYNTNLSGTYFEIYIPLNIGENIIEFFTNNTILVYAPNDSRSMYFNVRNINFNF